MAIDSCSGRLLIPRNIEIFFRFWLEQIAAFHVRRVCIYIY